MFILTVKGFGLSPLFRIRSLYLIKSTMGLTSWPTTIHVLWPLADISSLSTVITIPVLVLRMISLCPSRDTPFGDTGLTQVTLQDVTSLLQSINLRKSIVPDGLPNIILKERANNPAPSITALINCGLRHGLCPIYWKFADVTQTQFTKKTNKTLFLTMGQPLCYE